MNPYVKFRLIFFMSMFLMYLSVVQLDHVFFSQTRLYMMFVMLLFM